MAPPLIVHVHVPKTAGSSFRTLLQKYFGPDHANLYTASTHYYSESYLEEFIAGSPSLRSMSSHFIRTFPPRICDRTVLYVTFLRDPLEHFISYLTYSKKYFERLSEGALSELPPRASTLSSRDFADWIIVRNKVPYRENFQSNFFARIHFLALHPERDERLYLASRPLLVRTILQQFFFVGVAERMEESLRCLACLGRQFDVEFPGGPIGIENVSSDYRDSLEWIHAGDEVGARLLASLAEDRRLYEWNLARFEGVLAAADRADQARATAPPNPPPFVAQLFWRFDGGDFNECQSIRQSWAATWEESTFCLEVPRLEQSPVQLRLDLADRPINLRVRRMSLRDAAGSELWSLSLASAPALSCMAGMKFEEDPAGGVIARIVDWDCAFLLPIGSEAVEPLRYGGVIEVVMGLAGDRPWHHRAAHLHHLEPEAELNTTDRVSAARSEFEARSTSQRDYSPVLWW
jgi:hypothetical protein